MLRDYDRPDPLSESDIIKIISNDYGLNVTLVKEFDSYVDRNYLLETVPSPEFSHNSNNCFQSQRYVFKVFSHAHSSNPQRIQSHNDIILFAKEAGYPAPKPMLNLEGFYQKMRTFRNKERDTTDSCLVSLLEFLEGPALNKVTLTESLCREIGRYAGWLDKIYKSYPLPPELDSPCMDTIWNLSNLPCLRSHLDVITDANRLTLIKDIIVEFEDDVLKHLDMFSRGLIHNDFNECNLVVSRDLATKGDSNSEKRHANGHDEVETSTRFTRPTSDGKGVGEDTYRIVGLIDFGEHCFGCHLYEVAVAICYTMMTGSGFPPFQAAGCILSGYLEHLKFSDFELRRLRICTLARLIQTTVLSLENFTANPNNTYIIFYQSKKWDTIDMLWCMSNEEFLEKLLNNM